MHDASKVLMGVPLSSDRPGVETYAVDPATYKSGLMVRLASTGLPSVTKSAGQLLGVSLGKSLSDSKKTSVIRAGEKIPVLLSLKKARGTVTITSYANLVSGTHDVVTVDGTAFTAQGTSVTLGQATFQAATSNAATAASLAAQINAHATAGAKVTAVVLSGAVVTLIAKTAGTAGNALTLAYTDNDTNIGATVSGATLAGGSNAIADVDYVAKGDYVYVSDTTGKADDSDSDSTVSNAVYVSGVLTGVDEDGNLVPAALVDIVGGL